MHIVLAAVIFTAISCACDSFVCSLVVAITERAIFLTKTASVAFLAGSRGQITPIFRTWIQYHQSYLQLVQYNFFPRFFPSCKNLDKKCLIWTILLFYFRAVREINAVLGSLIFLTHGFTGVSIIAFCYFFMSVCFTRLPQSLILTRGILFTEH